MMTNYTHQISIIPENDIDKYIYLRYGAYGKDKLDRFICNYNNLLDLNYIALACILNDDDDDEDFFIMEHNRQEDKTILTFKDIRDNILHTHKVTTVTHFTNPTYMYCYHICKYFLDTNGLSDKENFDYFKDVICMVDRMYLFAINPTSKDEVIEYSDLFQIICDTVDNPNKTVGNVKTFTFRDKCNDIVYYLPSDNLLKALVKANKAALTTISIDDDGNESYSYWVSNARYMDVVGLVADSLTKHPNDPYTISTSNKSWVFNNTYTIVNFNLNIERICEPKFTRDIGTAHESYPI